MFTRGNCLKPAGDMISDCMSGCSSTLSRMKSQKSEALLTVKEDILSYSEGETARAELTAGEGECT